MLSSIGSLFSCNHSEQCRLTGTVGTDDTNNSSGRKFEAQVVVEEVARETFAEAFGFNYNITKTGPGGDKELQVLCGLSAVLVQQAFIGVYTGLGFGMAPLGSHLNPFKLPFQGLLALRLFLLLLEHSFLLLVEPG